MKKYRHFTYYFLEFGVLLVGFVLISAFAYNIYLQVLFLGLTLISYIMLGVIHHEIHHSMKIKIMVEYLLVSLIILAAFVFLNSTRL